MSRCKRLTEKEAGITEALRKRKVSIKSTSKDFKSHVLQIYLKSANAHDKKQFLRPQKKKGFPNYMKMQLHEKHRIP